MAELAKKRSASDWLRILLLGVNLPAFIIVFGYMAWVQVSVNNQQAEAGKDTKTIVGYVDNVQIENRFLSETKSYLHLTDGRTIHVLGTYPRWQKGTPVTMPYKDSYRARFWCIGDECRPERKQ